MAQSYIHRPDIAAVTRVSDFTPIPPEGRPRGQDYVRLTVDLSYLADAFVGHWDPAYSALTEPDWHDEEELEERRGNAQAPELPVAECLPPTRNLRGINP